MKKIIALIFIISCFVSYSQKKTKEERRTERVQKIEEHKKLDYDSRERLEYDYSFALIVCEGRLFSKKVDVFIDFGQNQKFFQSNRIVDENGKLIIFYSVTDALNYMKHLGWDFVDAYAITIGNQNVYHYLFENKGDSIIPKLESEF